MFHLTSGLMLVLFVVTSASSAIGAEYPTADKQIKRIDAVTLKGNV